MPTEGLAGGPAAVAGDWWVIGASGFLGRHAGRLLTSRGEAWIGTSALGRSPAEPLDLADGAAARRLERLLARHPPAAVLHLGGHGAAADERALVEIYAGGTERLLAALAGAGFAGRTVIAGSAAVYGEVAGDRRAGEDDPLRPVTAYGRAKAAQEAVAARHRADGLAVTVARVFNPVGPGQGPERLAGALIARLARGERPLAVRAADEVRDWIDARDVVAALVRLAVADAPPEAVNVCTGRGVAVGDLAAILAACAGVPLRWQPADRATAGRIARSVGDPRRLTALGWRPAFTLEQSLEAQWRAASEPEASR